MPRRVPERAWVGCSAVYRMEYERLIGDPTRRRDYQVHAGL
jgi:hypothetical protein